MPSTSLPTASTSPAHSSPMRAPLAADRAVLVAGGDQQVGPIERGGTDPDQDLVGLGRRLRHIADLDAGITEDGSFHGGLSDAILDSVPRVRPACGGRAGEGTAARNSLRNAVARASGATPGTAVRTAKPPRGRSARPGYGSARGEGGMEYPSERDFVVHVFPPAGTGHGWLARGGAGAAAARARAEIGSAALVRPEYCRRHRPRGRA